VLSVPRTHPYRTFSPAQARARRFAAGLSRDQAAVAVGRTVSAITQIERGDFTPSTATVGRLAAVYRCAVDDLFVGGAR
jgi:transcriptional regulator with XRE-family HTH domain